jgi:hypothetical protein
MSRSLMNRRSFRIQHPRIREARTMGLIWGYGKFWILVLISEVLHVRLFTARIIIIYSGGRVLMETTRAWRSSPTVSNVSRVYSAMRRSQYYTRMPRWRKDLSRSNDPTCSSALCAKKKLWGRLPNMARAARPVTLPAWRTVMEAKIIPPYGR